MPERADNIRYPKLERENETKVPDDSFRSEYINFLHPKIELVRNNFVFENLAYDSIKEVVLSDGYLIKNRWLIRTLSILAIYFTAKFLFFGITVSGGIEHWNLAQWFNKGSLIGVWGPILLLVGASLALYQSLIKSPILTIGTNNKPIVVRIKKLEENKTLEQLQIFLHGKGLKVIDHRKVKAE
jgi:hypothetical protein